MSEYAKEIMKCCHAVEEITGLAGWDFCSMGDAGEHIFVFLKLPEISPSGAPRNRGDVVQAFSARHDLPFVRIATIRGEDHLDIRAYDQEELIERIGKLRVVGNDFRETVRLLSPVPA